MFTDSSDDYAELGAAYIEAWEILADQCEIPPSLEVFQHEYEIASRSSDLRVTEFARRLAFSYRRTLVG